MPHQLRYKKVKSGYAIRQGIKFQDVAKVYSGGDEKHEKEALRFTKLFCASVELETIAKKMLPFLEVLISADVTQEAFSETINKKYIKGLCRELHAALKKIE
jgi:hypothetical protein